MVSTFERKLSIELFQMRSKKEEGRGGEPIFHFLGNYRCGNFYIKDISTPSPPSRIFSQVVLHPLAQENWTQLKVWLLLYMTPKVAIFLWKIKGKN